MSCDKHSHKNKRQAGGKAIGKSRTPKSRVDAQALDVQKEIEAPLHQKPNACFPAPRSSSRSMAFPSRNITVKHQYFFHSLVYLQTIVQPKHIIVHVISIGSSRYQLKHFTEMQRISPLPDRDMTSDKNDERISSD